ncbi:glycerophosphocholine cholinephosphodiesterase ENPP6-like [Oratosquilla oratoria]|uniref:glycerophosphocholine cholinephosphodiesterase ENPP6-like n=1 Tax=Oratosquilla oratoria TaxID=337810 RepID=UPI003F76183E
MRFSRAQGHPGWVLSVLLFLTTMLTVWGFSFSCFGFGRGRRKESTVRKSHNKLLYINMDGFRWDYADDQPGKLPGFSRFLKDGVRAAWTNPPYPTLSFPSITTLATGLYPEEHGIVGNFFYDKDTKEVFSMYNPFATGMSKWYTAEPIWTTATRSGRRTALYFWARCDVTINGVHPEVCMPFLPLTDAIFFRHNLDKAVDRLEEGFDFVQVYVAHADAVGHRHGPDSRQRKRAIRELDEALAHLMNLLDCRGLTDEVNIVIVSDHGMTTTDPKNTIQLEIDNFLDTNLVENLADYGAFMNIKVHPGNVEKARTTLTGE